MTDTIEYRELVPPAHLQAHIRCIWRLRGPRVDVAAAEPIVPDGCCELVINLGDPFIRQLPRGSHVQPRRLVAGQITRAIAVGPSGSMDLWGIRFHPWSAAAFLGVSAEELRDRFISLDEALPTLDRALSAIEAITGDDARYAAIIDALSPRAARIAAADGALPRLVSLAADARDSFSVVGLARHAGVSTRKVQLWFRESVGLAPKQLLRIARFQRALGIARANPALAWSAVAARAGYYDQAHLIHESNEIVGCTPAVLLGRDSALTDAFLTD